ncbi:MAG: hypothetical protein PHX21_05955 [bacterium]|nr:hypothetical protein [bacterium]
MGEKLNFVTGAIALPQFKAESILLPAILNYQAIHKQERGSSTAKSTMPLEKM